MISLACVCAAMMIIPTTSLDLLPGASSRVRPESTSSNSNNTTTFYPYLNNASSYPLPDAFTNVTGNMSLPQLSITEIGGVPIYLVAFVWNPMRNITVVALMSGQYSPATAQHIFSEPNYTQPTCLSWCANGMHLPIAWNAPIPIAAYAPGSVQGLAMTSLNNQIAVAVAARGYTSVYFSSNLGARGSWISMTGNLPVAGVSPRLSLGNSCSIALTTLSIGALYVTQLPFNCTLPMPNTWTADQTIPPRPNFYGPGVSAVIASQGPFGQSVLLNGTNLQSVTRVDFANLSAAFVTVPLAQPPPNPPIWAIQAFVPNGTGLVNVQVYGNGSWSKTNCSNQFQYGAPLPPGTPQVENVTPNIAGTGALLTLRGDNFRPGAQVFFGSAGPYTPSTILPNQITIHAPAGGGTVIVNVTSSGLTSPATCAGYFTYLGPSLSSLSDPTAVAGATIVLYGAGFNPSAQAAFNGINCPTTYISPGALLAVVPAGTPGSRVPVMVSETVGISRFTSNTLQFTYAATGAPWVTSVSPAVGPVGTNVAIHGVGFTPGGTAWFGSVPVPASFISSTLEMATAPSQNGTVNLTLFQGGINGANTCNSHFTYGPPLAPSTPFVSCLRPVQGGPGSGVLILGSNLTQGLAKSSVSFGGVPESPRGIASSSSLFVNASLGNGSVPVLVTTSVGTSMDIPQDRFRLYYPPPYTMPAGRVTAKLPAAYSAAPLGIGEVIASNVSNSKIVFYSGDPLFGYTTRVLAPFNASSGTSWFDQIGSTNSYTPNGTPGEVAIAGGNGFGPMFVVYTSNSGGRTVAETISSTDGLTWSGPYLASAQQGTVADPAAWTSPAGYFYVTWRENGGGSWQVDQTVFGPSGRIISSAQPLRGSGGSTGYSAGAPSVVVDPLDRPFYVWSANVPGQGNISEYTGDFPTASTLLTSLRLGFNNTTAPDFLKFGQPALGAFQTRISHEISWTQANVSASHLCKAQQDSLTDLYTNITTFQPLPLIWGPPITGCSLHKPIDQSLVANTTGPMAPDVYLLVGTWTLFEALGIGTMPIPDEMFANLSIYMPPNGGTGLFAPGQSGSASDAHGDVAQIQPIAIDPIDVWLNTTSSFTDYNTVTALYSHGMRCGSVATVSTPVSFWSNVTVGSTSGHYTSSIAPPSVFLLNLTSQSSGNWQATVAATYNASQTTFPCTGSPFTTYYTTPPNGWPKATTLSLMGTWETGLSPYPWTLAMNSTPVANHRDIDTLHWTNTMEATAGAWVNYTSNGSSAAAWGNGNYRTSEMIGATNGFQPLLGGTSYLLTVLLQSKAAGKAYNMSWTPRLDTGQFFTALPQTAYFSCSFTQLSNPAQLYWYSSNNITNLSSTSATITWYAAGQGNGWVTYNDSFGYPYAQTAQVIALANGSFKYVAQLHGLDPWGTYNLTAHVKISAGCTAQSGLPVSVYLAYSNSTPIWYFNTAAVALLTEQDFPYDSVTHQGGGAAAYFQVPTDFTARATFLNGSMKFTNVTSNSKTIVVPLAPPLLPAQSAPSGWLGASWLNTTYQVNFTGLSLNMKYSFALALNYSVNAGPMKGRVIHGVGQPFNFTYEKSTSGDGLTDWEKVRGWTVAYTDVWGNRYTKAVTAQPSLWATNGLVNDFVEKEFGLDPTRVDTAGSHMLDTWNLTFDLGSTTATPPATTHFQYWYEIGKYNWLTGCPNYQPTGCASWSPLSGSQTWSNLSGNDAGAWAAKVLWSRAALSNFLNFSGVKQSSWLRAVLGSTASGERTVTVWGKLSWGANPLAASSTQDGLADGARIDPLVHRYLQLSSLNAGLSSSCSGLSNGVGWEIHLFINDSTPSGHAEVQNYTNGSQVSGSGCGSLTGYTVSVPIDQTMQNQSLTAQFAYNDGSLKSLAVNGSSKSAIVHLDAFLNSASTGGHSYSGTGSGTSLSFTETTIRVAGKSPTWLWLPDGNGTLSPAPWGLKTYTGEQAFDLVTVNNQYGSTLSASVPNFWALSTTTPLSLPSGLNNLLIPRAQFLNSSLGHGLILGKGFQDSSSSTPPMLGTSELSAISTFSASNDLTGVGCYWQNRGISSSAGGLCSNEGTIPSDSSNLRVRVEGDGNWSSSNGGGMPLKPGALNTTSEGASLQAALTLNVSSTTELNLLLAGLIDNATGGVNGSFTAITYEVPLLGFAPAVVKAIANQPVTSDGLFGAPTYNPPPTPPQTSFWGSVWNTVSGIGNAVINGVSTVVAAAWTVATAALHYLSNAASALGQYAEQAIKTIVSGLVGLGNLLLKALQWALQAFLKLLKSALQAAFAPLQKILVSWALNVNQSLKDALTSGDISLATSQEMWSAISGTGYEIGMTLAYVVEAALAVAAVLSADSEELAMTAVSAFVGLALGMFMPAITAFITQSMVHTTENTANGTLNQHPQQTWWNVSAESFGWYAAGYTNIQAASDLYKDANNPGSGPAKVVTDAIGFAVGLEALLITVMSIATGIKSCALAIWGLILDVSSIVVDIIGMALPASGPTAASDAEDGLGLDDITLLIDTATFEIDLGQMATYGC